MRRRTIGFIGMIVAAAAVPAAFGQFSVGWYSIDGGGRMDSAGGGWSCGSTSGQADAGSFAAPMAGGPWQVAGGFWAVAAPLSTVAGDLDCDGALNNFDIDAFVLAITDPAGYAAAHPGCPISNADMNGDNAVNNFDIDFFVLCLSTGQCP